MGFRSNPVLSEYSIDRTWRDEKRRTDCYVRASQRISQRSHLESSADARNLYPAGTFVPPKSMAIRIGIQSAYRGNTALMVGITTLAQESGRLETCVK